MFVGDTNIDSEVVSTGDYQRLQQALDQLAKWIKKWKIKFNSPCTQVDTSWAGQVGPRACLHFLNLLLYDSLTLQLRNFEKGWMKF